MKKIILIVTAILSGVFVSCVSCGNNKEEKSENNTTVTKTIAKEDKQLNITFLLDLSDRIEPSKYPATPQHWERDIAIINEFVQVFKNDLHKKRNFKFKGKMKVLFSPAPEDTSINEIAQKLEVDASEMKPAEKTAMYKNLEQDFTENLKKIYTKTLETKKYIGSDIWRFFKSDVKGLTIDNDPNYRNILVVITDGYLYHKNTKMKEKNRFSYITAKVISSLGLTNSKWKEKMDKIDFGLIPATKDLGNLEILMLELNPSKKSSPYEEEVMKEVLKKWFEEMGVQKFDIHTTYADFRKSKKRIENFIQNN